jgi:peptidoglycan/LPS O-acetylase OafA/YrhL
MKEPDEPPRIWDNKRNVARLLNALYALCAVLVVLDFIVHRHTEHPWEHVVAFYPLYGFFGIVILVLAAKGLRRLVMRPEDYYDVE